MIIANELRKDIAKKEITRNPIFLLQYLSSYCVCGDSLSHEEHEDRKCEELLEVWDTISVFSTREAAETFAKQTEYRYPEGWQVFCITCSDELNEILNEHETLLKVCEQQRILLEHLDDDKGIDL